MTNPVWLIPMRAWPRPDVWLDVTQAGTFTLEDTDRVAAWASRMSGAESFAAAGDARPTLGSGMVTFDGTDERLAESAFTYSKTVLSVAVVLRTTVESAQYACGHWNAGADQRGWTILTVKGAAARWVVYLSASKTGVTKEYRAAVDLTDGTDHALGFTFFNNELRLFEDGVERTDAIKTIDTSMTTIGTSTADVTVGGDAVGFFGGSIKQFAMWNRRLNPRQMRAALKSLKG